VEGAIGPRVAREPGGGRIPATLRRQPLRGTGHGNQIAYAERGTSHTEMEFIAVGRAWIREFVSQRGERGRAIIPANINHPESEPMVHRTQLPGEDQRTISGTAPSAGSTRKGARSAGGLPGGRRHGDGTYPPAGNQRRVSGSCGTALSDRTVPIYQALEKVGGGRGGAHLGGGPGTP